MHHTTHPNRQMHPIGIFDSGIGGLTIAKAITSLLPNENIIYFGDTAHLPYGDKSAKAIQYYVTRIADWLIEKHCKMVVIACHSASAAAHAVAQQHIGQRALLVNVIDPTVQYVSQQTHNNTVGLIGTTQTIRSNAYHTKFSASGLSVDFQACPTPLLAKAIEEGLHHPTIIDNLLDDYLSDPQLQNIESLILGCTHYPVIKDKIQRYYNNRVNIIDTSEIIAETVQAELSRHELLNPGPHEFKHFYVSDYTQHFADSTRLFFDENIMLEHYPLWE